MKYSLKVASFLMALLLIVPVGGCAKKEDKEETTVKNTTQSQSKTTQKSSATGKTTSKSSTTAATPTTSTDESPGEDNSSDNSEDDTTIDESDEGIEESDESLFNDGAFAGLKYSPGNIDFKGGDVLISNAYWPGIETAVDEIKVKREQAVEALYNFKKVDVLLDGNTYKDELITSMIAGIRLADIVLISTKDAFPVFIKNNFFVPLNDYIDFEVDPWVTYASASKYVNGLSYSMRRNISGERGLVFNREILYREGCPDPIELVKVNNWTWETFLDIAIKCTRDFDGDGINDQFGIGGSSLVICIMHSNGARIVSGTEDGSLVSTLDTPAAMRAFEFCQQLINIYKVTNNQFGSIVNNRNDFLASKLAMFFDTVASSLNRAIQAGLMECSYAPFPLGPDAPEIVITGTGSSMACIATNTIYDPKDLIAAYLKMNYVDPNGPDYLDPYESFKKQVMYTQPMLVKEEDVQFWFDFSNRTKRVLDNVGSFSQIDSYFNRNIASEILTTPIITVIDKYKQVIADLLKDF